MSPVAIFLVPTGVAQRDFEEALREHFLMVEICVAGPQSKPPEIEGPGADELPLWTWFVSNESFLG